MNISVNAYINLDNYEVHYCNNVVINMYTC